MKRAWSLICALAAGCTFDFGAFEDAGVGASDAGVLDAATDEQCLALLENAGTSAAPDGGLAAPTCRGDGGPCARIVELEVAVDHSCIRDDRGDVYCWGSNRFGQLARSGTTSVSRIPRTPAFRSATSVSVAFGLTCVTTTGGGVQCAGDNAGNRLGVGRSEPGDRPGAVPGIAEADAVASGTDRSCALANGRVGCWPASGMNNALVRFAGGEALERVSRLEAGGRVYCARSAAAGVLACWGDAEQGALGIGESGAVATALEARVVGGCDRPLTQVVSFGVGAGARPQGADAGSPSSHVCAVSSGDVWCWGANSAGQTGQPAGGPVWSPRRLDDARLARGRARAVAVGAALTCVLRDDGQLFCFGDNSAQLVAPNAPSTHEPRLRADDVVMAGVGLVHGCLVRASGALQCWGRSPDGNTASGTTTGNIRDPADVVWEP